jgi:hypothetical protein
MPSLVLYEPAGRVIHDSSLLYVRDALNEGEDYGSAGCGQLSINLIDGKVDCDLIVTPDDTLRFHLDYAPGDGDMDWFTTKNGDRNAQAVTVWVSGEDHLLPGDSFLSAEQAWMAG